MANTLHIQFQNSAGFRLQGDWDICDSGLAQRWAANFLHALRLENTREQRFFGWNWSDVYKQKKLTRLGEAVGVINRHFTNSIEIDPAKFLQPSQETLNFLHHKFELFMGQSWNRNKLSLDAPLEVQIAIRELNDFVHDIEYSDSPEDYKKRGQLWLRGFQCQLAPYTQIPLEPDDFHDFTFESEPGDVVTNYCQLGKTWVEAFINKDEHIQLSNIAPLKYFSSGFICNFHGYSAEDSKWLTHNVREYIGDKSKKYGISLDKNDPKLALGHIKYAKLSSSSSLQKMSDREQIGFFTLDPKISKIILCFHGEAAIREFSYAEKYVGVEESFPSLI